MQAHGTAIQRVLKSLFHEHEQDCDANPHQGADGAAEVMAQLQGRQRRTPEQVHPFRCLQQ
jgi:hypothetical protein